MAVELRCPDCRAKLKLKEAPDAGTEVECPKCGTVFAAPEPQPDLELEGEEEDAPKPKEKAEKESKPKKDKPAPGTPRKRRAKKRETSKVALIAVISAGVLMLLSVTGVLIWYFTRTSKSVEMMLYVPEDAQTALGVNLGHAQKYPELYKSVGGMHAGQEYKVAGDAIAKAAGIADMDALADYVVVAASAKNGSAIVYRTKSEFDEAALGKLGGEKKTADGKTYYSVALTGSGEKQRVFSPTNRLIVVASQSTPEATFKKMLHGHADSKEKTLGVRMGDLGKRVTRGTFWQMTVFDNELKAPATPSTEPPAGSPPGTPPASADDPKAQLQRTFAETLNGARGFGIKASLGSREVRFEVIAWYKDSEKSKSVATKWKESELGKGDEGTPPKWFKDITNGMGDRKVGAQLLSNIGFGASGDLFFAKSAAETIDFQQGAGGALARTIGVEKKSPRRRRFGLVARR